MKSRRGSAFALSLLAGACATGSPSRPARRAPAASTRDFASGTRLRARASEIDGALVLREFFDQERGEACSFLGEGSANVGPGPNGPFYWCLPRGMAIHDGATGPFADAACTVPLAIARLDAPATYLVVRPADACLTAPRVHRAGKVETSFPYALEGGVCRNSRTPTPTQAPAEEIPLDAFVRAEERVEDPPAGAAAPSPRIASLVAVGADGSRLVVGAWDRERNEAVRVAESSRESRWVPSRVAFEGASDAVYADARCDVALATKISRDARCPITGVVRFPTLCPEDATYHALGAPASSLALHQLDPSGACKPSPRSGLQAFAVGAPIPTAAFAPATFVDVGGDRVRRRGYSAPGSAVVFWGSLVDAQSNAACAPTEASDGVIRCLPLVAALVDLYADATCSTPAFARASTGCEETPSGFIQVPTETGASVYRVIAEAPELFALRGDACVPHRPVVRSRGYAVEEVPVERFAPVTDVEE